MSHANAALTPRARLKVARLVIDQGVPIAEVAARFQVSWPTVKRWSVCYAAGEPMGEIFYYNYPGASSVIRGAVFGRIAGAHAASRARA